MVLSIARYGRKSPVGCFPGGWKEIYGASIFPTLKSGVRLITVACKTPMTSVISDLLTPAERFTKSRMSLAETAFMCRRLSFGWMCLSREAGFHAILNVHADGERDDVQVFAHRLLGAGLAVFVHIVIPSACPLSRKKAMDRCACMCYN